MEKPLEDFTFKSVLKKIRKKDFQGKTGLAIENSFFQFSSGLITKITTLLFTIILARLLVPEVFGLYSLVLSTLLIFVSLSDFGVNQTAIRFVSRSLALEHLKNAKEYLVYFSKIKLFLTAFSVIVLFAIAKYLADNYYGKPIFLALLVGTFFLIFRQGSYFLQTILQAKNYFRGVFLSELVFQIARIVIVPLSTIFALKYSLSYGVLAAVIIFGISFSYLLSIIVALKFINKKCGFIKENAGTLNKKLKAKARHFILLMSITVFSGTFFANIDKFMLGHFVASQFIGYFDAASSLVAAAIALVPFSVVLLPLFSGMEEERLSRAFNKVLSITLLISFFASLLIALFAPNIISLVYGAQYAPAANILRLLSLTLIIGPATALFHSYFIARGTPQVMTKILFFTTPLNVGLNYIFIKQFIVSGEINAVFGVVVATLITKFIYFVLLAFSKKFRRKKQSNIAN